jgi:hypothetical protein
MEEKYGLEMAIPALKEFFERQASRGTATHASGFTV